LQNPELPRLETGASVLRELHGRMW
jgi:hypothetical protein